MTTPHQSRRAVVLYESMFGNTEKIARAVVAALRRAGWQATDMEVVWADGIPADVDLLVLGAPTHAFSLSRPSTRADAVRRGASPTRAGNGLREWLARVPEASDGSPLVAVFDTRVSTVRRLPATAGRTLAKLARRRGFRLLGRPRGFLVEDVEGPLLDGELERAAEWGQRLATTAGS